MVYTIHSFLVAVFYSIVDSIVLLMPNTSDLDDYNNIVLFSSSSNNNYIRVLCYHK